MIGENRVKTLEESGRVSVVRNEDSLPQSIRKVIQASQNELGSDVSDLRRVKKQVLEKFKRELEEKGSQVTVRCDSAKINLTVRGAKHALAFNRATWKDALALLHIRELTEEAHSPITQDNLHGNKDPFQFTHYQGEIEIDGETCPVDIVIAHYTNQQVNFYHVGIKKARKDSGALASKRGFGAPLSTSGFRGSVSASNWEIKYSKGGEIQGVYDPATGKSNIIAGNTRMVEGCVYFRHGNKRDITIRT